MSATQTNAARPIIQQNPFPGLRPFDESEARLFFGREQEIVALLGRMMRQHFLAVLGSSGCGKSSLIKAGLIPSLKYEQLDDGQAAWRIAVMRPGDDPFKQLAVALTRGEALGKSQERSEADVPVMQMILRRGPLGIVEAVRAAALPPEAKVLVLVDQFEELFRFPVHSEKARALDEARAFVNLLLAAAGQRDYPVYIAITMRSEFLGQCAAFRGLAEAITDGLYLLPDMTRDQLREVIHRPVAAHNGSISERLVNRLLNDLGGNSDQLPILQHALMRLWVNWEPRRAAGAIDLGQYEVIGELNGSLSAHAESIYQEDLRSVREKELAETLFRSITETTAEGQTVRKPTKLRIICRRGGASVEELRPVIEQFRREGRSFLTPQQGVELDGESTIDISHESLIRQWARLSDWAQAEAKESKLYADLKRDAALWNEKGRALDWLYTGERLAEVRRWAETHPNLIDDELAKEFLASSTEIQKYAGLLSRAKKWNAEGRDESLLFRGRELDEAEQWLGLAQSSDQLRPILLRKEVKDLVYSSRRAKNSLWWLKAGLAVTFGILLITTVFALIALVSAIRQSKVAEAQRQVAEEQSIEAIKQRKEVEYQKDMYQYQRTLAEKRLGEIDDLKRQLGMQPGSGDSQDKGREDTDAGIEIRKLRQLVEGRQSIPILYFYKPEDGTKVATSLQEVGYKVTARAQTGSAPTNAIWWGDGIELKDLQFIAYTLINNGFSIRYIGKMSTTGQIQIGGRPLSLSDPVWTVDKVRSLTRLPD